MSYQNTWSSENEQQLRFLILQKHQYDWSALACYFSVSIEEVKTQWQDKIYPTIRSDKKIAGAFIWTQEEDKIIQFAGTMTDKKLEILLEFLPGRTHFSLEARWKRIHLKNSYDKKKPIVNMAQNDLVMRNHQKRLKQYQEILKMREVSHGKQESDIQKIVETGDNSIRVEMEQEFV